MTAVRPITQSSPNPMQRLHVQLLIGPKRIVGRPTAYANAASI
jgi:hypothetical protein